MTADLSASPGWPLPHGIAIFGMATLIGMSFLCIFELNVLLVTQFRSRNGLYFWSLVVGVFGELLYALGTVLYFFILGNSSPWTVAMLWVIGYLLYIPAEFMVLYSRLNLLSPNPRLLRIVLCWAAAESILVSLPNAIILAGYLLSTNPEWTTLGNVFLKVEASIYTVTGIFLSGVYIYSVMRMWSRDQNSKVKTVLQHLIYTAIFVALLNVCNLVLAFRAEWQIESCFLVSYVVESR
jgi:hypothetical protein